MRPQFAVTTETAWGVATPVTAAGAGTVGFVAVVEEPPPPQADRPMAAAIAAVTIAKREARNMLCKGNS